MHDEFIGVDGSILKKPAVLDDQNVNIDYRVGPPSEVTITLTYDRHFVLPFTKKERTKTFTYSHTEDMSPVKY